MIRIWIDMDDTLCDFTSASNKAITENPAIQFPQATYGFFRNLKPIPGAIKGVKELQSLGFDVRILTRPSVKNPLCYTEKREWIEMYLGYELCEKLWLSPDKKEEVKEGDYLIDDSDWKLKEGEQIQFGKAPFENWTKVIEYLKTKINK